MNFLKIILVLYTHGSNIVLKIVKGSIYIIKMWYLNG